MPALSDGKYRIDNVRISFANIFTPGRENDNGTAKYSVSMLFAKDHPDIPNIVKGMEDAAKKKWPNKWEEVMKALKAGDRLALHDGDSKADKYPYYAGLAFMNASNEIKPKVRDLQRNELTIEDGKPYSGCYCNVIIEFWGQDNKYGKRVNASLMGVQFVEDGERLAGGGTAADDDFAEIPEEQAQAAEESGSGAQSFF